MSKDDIDNMGQSSDKETNQHVTTKDNIDTSKPLHVQQQQQ